jgi:hypothetical protein
MSRKRQELNGERGSPAPRVHLGIRITPQIKHALHTAAFQSGRSQSQEAEMRLEMSFRDDRMLDQMRVLVAGIVGELSGKVSAAPPSLDADATAGANHVTDPAVVDFIADKLRESYAGTTLTTDLSGMRHIIVPLAPADIDRIFFAPTILACAEDDS